MTEISSVSAWIDEHGPAVADLPPEAPLTAAWFDWHQRVGREHLDVLDSAFEAVTGSSIKPGEKAAMSSVRRHQDHESNRKE